jgi:hypothetical protein
MRNSLKMTNRINCIKREVFPQATILHQRDKILGCPKFSKSVILSKFLCYIVNETILGRQNSIKEYTIGIEVLNKPKEFNPVLDGIVRVHACRLREYLSMYYKEKGIEDNLVINVPKGRYLPVFKELHHVEVKKKTEAIFISRNHFKQTSLSFENSAMSASVRQSL